MMKNVARGFLVLALLLLGANLNAEVPDGEFSFSYRQVVDEKPSKSVHQVNLQCGNGTCVMFTLTMNQCIDGAFYPKVEYAISGTEELDVSSPKPNIVVIRQNLGPTVITFRVVLEDLYGLRVKDVTGAAVKNSELLQDVITWRIQSLKGDDRLVRFGCPAQLDGPIE